MFTQAVAPGDFTEQVVPALLMEEPARKVSFTTAGGLLYQNDEKSRWRMFDPQDTVFADALRAGATTGVVGWHNPYCRLLSAVLDRCFWTSQVDSATADFDGSGTFAENALAPARHLLRGLAHRGNAAAIAARREADLHIADVKQLTAASEAMLKDPAIDFMLIHLPVPHPAGIFDRSRMEFSDTERTSYVDNLALADQVLGAFRRTLSTQGAWDSATVVVMGDHAWRTKLLWEGQSSWTPEDQRASHGGEFDPRPVYMVKLPGQHAGVTVNGRFETLRTRALLDAVLSGALRTPEKLVGLAPR